ncbi:MAG: Type 4 prepilin-like protein leader peptide-processing enzyme [Microgenomates bacterium OLB23]|nr:MAG: Type 4 prepilin-like protein leader peptide-processing enzyme [Microgenomates bacterium OLB23]
MCGKLLAHVMHELLTTTVFILGLCIGSFLNVVIDRMSVGKTLLGRSMCDFCKRVLQPIELVPILSWVVQRGYSRCCGKRLSWQYPVVEILTGVVFVVIYNLFYLQGGELVVTLAAMGIASSLIVITVADVKYRIIPDAALAALALFRTWSWQDRALSVFAPQLFAAAVLFSGMALLFAATRGRGIGFGDVKFAGIIGFLMGLQSGFIALYVAFVTGGVMAIILLLTTKKGLKSEVPFGPFMVWGMVAAMLWGSQLSAFFYSLF